MSTVRMFTMLIALVAGSMACRDKAARERHEREEREEEQEREGKGEREGERESDSERLREKLRARDDDKPAAPDPSVPVIEPPRVAVSAAEAQRYVAFFDRLIAIAVADQDDCARLAKDAAAHITANQALLHEAAEGKAHHRELPAPVKDQIARKIADELTPALHKCGSDKTVIDALVRVRPAGR